MRYPQGKLAPDDLGELTIAVIADYENQVVRVDFGKPVPWLGMDKASALSLARGIIAKAEQLD
jgi:hypothetical protein